MNEFQAAMGLSNLSSIDRLMLKRKKIYSTYKKYLSRIENIEFQSLQTDKYNYSYMPILLKNKKMRDKLFKELLKNKIKARKYFYPLISDFGYLNKEKYSKELLFARQISNRVLCLPIYYDLRLSDVKRIINIVSSIAK